MKNIMFGRLSVPIRRFSSTVVTSKAPSADILSIWRSASAVCFDVDSTVATEEGIDVLADVCGKGQEVAAWTAKAMGGSVTFQEALAARLELIKPGTKELEQTLRERPAELSPGMKDLFKLLKERGTDTYLVSGGFKQMIEPIAEQLDVPVENIYANVIQFNEDGIYAGFDHEALTSRTGGKAKVINMLKEKFNYDKMVMVGDGATDMEARPPADAFIGYGGVVVRDVVKDGADWFVTDIHDMIAELKKDV